MAFSTNSASEAMRSRPRTQVTRSGGIREDMELHTRLKMCSSPLPADQTENSYLTALLATLFEHTKVIQITIKQKLP
jgi:hypothetical protein